MLSQIPPCLRFVLLVPPMDNSPEYLGMHRRNAQKGGVRFDIRDRSTMNAIRASGGA
jgi:hypothetical protein